MIVHLAAVLVVLIWLYLLLGREGFWHVRDANLSREEPKRTFRIAVVMPARDEAAVVGRAVASLLNQHYAGPFHLFLVDDHSSDGTVRAALRAAAEMGRPELLTVVAARPLPPRWTGKLWAIAEGIAGAEAFDPDYILLTDADIVHPWFSLTSLAGQAEAGRYDLVSLMVRLRCEALAEKALIPAFVYFFFKLYPPAWVRHINRPTAAAAGGCMLVSKAILARIGGIATIHREVIDDCALAKVVKQRGGRIWLGLSFDTTSIREHDSFKDIWRMISRTAFAQLHHSPLLLAATIAGMFVTYMVPPLLLLAGPPLAAILGGIAWGIMTITYAPTLTFFRCSALWALSLPLVALFYTGATIDSAVRYWLGQGGEWKGRVQDAR